MKRLILAIVLALVPCTALAQYGGGSNDFYRQQLLMQQQEQVRIQQEMLNQMRMQQMYQPTLPPPQYVPNPVDSFLQGYQRGRDMRMGR